jgi:hypothetical protein
MEPVEQDRRQATRFEYNPATTRRFRQLIGNRSRYRRRLAFVDDLAFAIEKQM